MFDDLRYIDEYVFEIYVYRRTNIYKQCIACAHEQVARLHQA
jgi:hypothetical protein